MILTDDPRRLQTLALGALLVALILRLGWGIAIPVIPTSDGHAYDVFAQNIAQGFGYGWRPNDPSVLWPVGTSAIYAACFWLFGHNYAVIMLLQVIVGVAIVALAMSLAREWFDDKVAVTTGWILACWPLLIQFTTILASEMFFLLFVLLAFRLASLPGRSWSARVLLSGLALAAASYIRPTALLMSPLLFAKNAVKDRQWFKAGLACIGVLTVMIACILPWTARNWEVTQRFVLISSNGGENLWMGNNPSGSLSYMPPPTLDIANPADRDKYLRALAIDYIVQHPVDFVVRSVKKMVVLHDRETSGVGWNEDGIAQRAGQGLIAPLKLISSAYWWVILALAIYGMYAYVKNSGFFLLLTFPPIVTWAYFTAIHAVTVAGDRYHIPSIPFIAMIAAYALTTRWISKADRPKL